MSDTLVIVGASTRAAAQSALRAGYQPVCFDRFADADLVRSARVTRVSPYPAGIPQAVAAAPPAPWMYTGAIENHRGVVAELARMRPLAGNPCHVLARVRNPLLLADVLRHAGLPVPACTLDPQSVLRDGTYLRKPLRSGGGAGIVPWDERCAAAEPTRGWYFQQRIDGEAYAAAYVAACGTACLVGLTQQRLTAGRRGGGFCYAGSVGPLEMSAGLRRMLQRLGEVLAGAFGLVGWFGVDGILAGGQFWTVEVNPRYTASAEIFERGLGISAVRLHLEACLKGNLPQHLPNPTGVLHGKAILFAPHRLAVPPAFAARALQEASAGRWPALADVPPPHAVIPAGGPVLTVFASGGTADEVQHGLDIRLASLATQLQCG